MLYSNLGGDSPTGWEDAMGNGLQAHYSSIILIQLKNLFQSVILFNFLSTRFRVYKTDLLCSRYYLQNVFVITT